MSESVEAGDLEAMEAFARALAAKLRAGDVVALRGPLGAGKTTLARAIIRHCLGDPEFEVPSPTFTLVQTYPGPDFEIWHVDLYRLGGPAECVELGLEDAFSSALTLIEWPDRMGDDLPEHRIDVTIEARANGTRRIDVSRF